jgi:hypothetical protein
VQGEHLLVWRASQALPVEPTGVECVSILRVNEGPKVFESSELCVPSLANVVDQPAIAVADEVVKGSNFSVFLAHEEHGQAGRG